MTLGPGVSLNQSVHGSTAVGRSRVVGRANQPLSRVIATAGLTPALVLDAGDGASYSTGQSWNDLSGNTRHFNRGSDNTSQASDPTFNGTPGGLSLNEYFSCDGGDFFTKATANDAYLNGLHKDAATWSFVAAVFVPDLAGVVGVFSTCTASAGTIGAIVDLNATENLRYRVGNGVSVTTVHTSTATATVGAWNVVGFSISENGGASGSFSYVNGTATTFNASVASPSSSDASTVATFGALNGGGSNIVPNGFRFGAAAMFSTALTTANFDAIRASLRARYGI